MAPKYRGRRLIDNDGNSYVFECPLDVNADHAEDVLLSTHQGITKLVGYRLAIEGIYRDMEDQVVEPQTKFNFYKKVEVFAEGQNVSQEEFGKTMKELIEKARISRIGKVKITSWKGEPVLEDSRGYYVSRVITCAAEGCRNTIEGTIRLSLDTEGAISRGQNFIPKDKRVQRSKPGSKLWLCPTCSPVTIPVPDRVNTETQPPVPVESPKPEQEPVKDEIKKPVNKKTKLLDRLAELSDASSNVPAEYLKGFVAASLEILKGD